MRLEIRNRGLELGQGLRVAMERKLRFVLTRFSSRIGGIAVHVVVPKNHCPPGEVHCRIVIRLMPFGRVSVEVAATDLDTALNWAAKRIGPAVNRELLRWRDNGAHRER